MKWFARQRRVAGFQYSAWDGTQTGFDLDAEQLLDEMSDDLLYHGDLNAALRRLMQQGFKDRNNEQLMGLREMLQKLRERRREELENRDLGGVYDDIAEQLNEVVDMEREGIDQRVDEATRSGDQRRQEIVEDVAETAPPGARAAPARPRRQGPGAPGVRIHGRRRPPAVRGADGPAAASSSCRATSTSSPRACRT